MSTLFNSRGGSRTDTLIKLVLIFFISLLSFSVGTFVGKQFSDSQHKAAMMEPEFQSADRETASVPGDATEVKPEDAITEKDIQQVADEFSKPENEHAATTHDNTDHNTHTEEPAHHEVKNEPKNEHVETRAVAAEQKSKHSPSVHEKPLDAAKRVAEGMAPAEHKPEPVNPLTKELPNTVAATSIGKFTVQVSSHQNEEEAIGRASELKQKGFAAFVVPANIKGKQWYRVSVGLFDRRNEAITFQDKLKREAGVPATFVQQIVQ